MSKNDGFVRRWFVGMLVMGAIAFGVSLVWAVATTPILLKAFVGFGFLFVVPYLFGFIYYEVIA